MNKKKTRLRIAQDKANAAVEKTNKCIEELGNHTRIISDGLNTLQGLFDNIRNVPNEDRIKCEELKKIRLEWNQQAEKIEKDYKAAYAKNAGNGAVAAGAGIAVAALGPTAAMGVATTFGVASTGTAIAALHGAAATNAALAWLGGGALVAGGGGMAAGHAFLLLFGPVGWTISGVALLGTGLLILKNKEDKKRLENIFTHISNRDVTLYELAMVEINERIIRIDKEVNDLVNAIEEVMSMGLDYNEMTEQQQYQLGSYVNLMFSSTQLLVNPILGLKPKYSDEDFEDFMDTKEDKSDELFDERYKNLIISIANLLYKVEMDKEDRKIFYKTIKRNKKFLESLKLSKKDLPSNIIDFVCESLEYKYNNIK